MMNKIITTLSMMDKPLFYNATKHIQRAQAATITTLKLNSQPLPKQPVPDLKTTAEKYLKSVKPFLNEHEYSKTEKIVSEFISTNGPGPYLHTKLLERYENTSNWMSEWWFNMAYLGYRIPVIVNSNPGIVGPPQSFNSKDDAFKYAGYLIGAICDYNNMVKSGKMKQEMIRNEPLDMQPYGLILGTHRRPEMNFDRLLHTDDSNHIIIICNNHFFKLYLTDENGNVLNEEKIFVSLKDIAARAEVEAKPVGILTGNHRDKWASVHAELKNIGSNKKILEDIESALFILCLDKDIPKEAFISKNNASVRAVQSLTGYNSQVNAGNRWHDKTIQYIVSYDGFVGMEYEHTPCEGVPVAVLHDFVLKYVANKLTSPKSDYTKDFPRAQHLKFQLNDSLDIAIAEAVKAVDELSNDVDMQCFTFDKFGTDELKKCKLSPDSFIQMAQQLTFYKLHKKPSAHYESATLRRFCDARTECIRSTSIESVDFVKMLTNNNALKKDKKDALLKAVDAHKKYVSKAVLGEGVDRHLFGLKMIAMQEKIELPKIYSDPSYQRSTYFNLTSSQVPFKSSSFMCYGPVVPDGYGCCYNPRPSDILFACSSFKSCRETSSEEFANALQQSLCDMRCLFD